MRISHAASLAGFMIASQQEGCEHIVAHKNQHATDHDSGSRGIAHGFRSLAVAAPVGVIPLVTAYGDDDDSENYSLEEAAAHVAHGHA